MSSRRHPTSLQVQDRSTANSSSALPSTATEDVTLLRESQHFKRDMEREVERWMDVLMESPSVDRRFLRRASLYLQPNLYDEVTHERHLAMTCRYPTCSNRPRKPYSEKPKWRITNNTSYNASLRGPNKRDLVEVSGNPEDGFCNPACAVRSRWYRARLSVEPVWARSIVNVGDLKEFQAQLSQGRKVAVVSEEAELLEDMEDRGEIVIENGQPRRINRRQPLASSENQVGSYVPVEEASRNLQPIDKRTAPLPKSELLAESREHPSSLIQRLEETLAGLRIVEKTAEAMTANSGSQGDRSVTASATSNQQHQTKEKGDLSPLASSGSVKSPSRPHAIEAASPHPHRSMGNSATSPMYKSPESSADRRATQRAQTGDVQYEEEGEDDETRMVFDLALAARGHLEDGTF